MNADVYDDVLDNIDELMNFSCEDPEGDMIGAQSLEDICGYNCDGLFSGEGDTTSLLHKHLLQTPSHDHPDEDTPISVPNSIRSCSEIQNMPINAGLVVPGKAHIKRRRTEVFIHPPMTPLMSPISLSIDPPTTLKIPDPIATELKKWRKQKKLPVMPGSVEQSSSQQSRPVLKCLHCDITETPRWRTGPLGMTLCNACWLEFNRCLYFPEYRSAASQTFLTPAHSNSQPVIPLVSPSSIYPIPPTTVKRQKPIATELNKRQQKKPTAPGSSEHTALRQTRPDRRKCLCCDVTETPQSRVGPLRKRQSAGSPTIITLSDSETDPIPSEKDPIPPLSSELSSKSEDLTESTITLEVPKPVAGSNIKLPPLPDSIEQPMPIRKCLHCGITKTPLWRMGPSGPRTLCNACGVRYRTGRLLPEYRPAASPTFVPTLHSNSHKKLLKMRYKNLSEGNILAQV